MGVLPSGCIGTDSGQHSRASDGAGPPCGTFGEALPQEKVALHLDNTSYYQGDDIWFQCYVVASGLNRPTEWSKTLYVELLNPGGEIVSKQILPVRNGRCHGHFALTQLPFYSGFYEVRAYTKYMLNFDEVSVFSRIIPVFDKPAVPGHYVEKEISPRVSKYPQERKRPRKEKKLNLRFYPEGGYLRKVARAGASLGFRARRLAGGGEPPQPADRPAADVGHQRIRPPSRLVFRVWRPGAPPCAGRTADGVGLEEIRLGEHGWCTPLRPEIPARAGH